MFRQTYAAISKSAILQNLRMMADFAEKSDIMAVVKANAYGHGARAISELLAKNGVKWFGVSMPEEAFEIMDLCENVFILGPVCEDAFYECVMNEISFPIFTRQHLKYAKIAAEKAEKKAKVHIKIDTGMNRVGLKTHSELRQLLENMDENILIEGIFTHFANSDAEDLSFAKSQLEAFEGFLSIVREYGFDPIVHAANSGAIARIKDAHFDLMRLGVSLYGYHPEPCLGEVRLKPAMSLVSTISHVKNVKIGESISYSRDYFADKTQIIATAPIGYADGYKRLNAGKAHVLVRGKKCPLRGRVCMDQIMFDVSEIPNVKVGEQVTLMGSQGSENITADELAEYAQTINYEILTSISARMPLVYEE